ncbi:GGDEF domain-containing protein [Aurantiacibacter poecillastricola]|uniref:GGDEF domain-containing protein n=1 Tax=Aurantiacibacter poecillastricola TaxID=3064385 RepID=UPI00273F3134|nr:GGDEF domain-containing protein [Aurantiacibacter sp. 219JJ12-13]MDP5260161.1 GGDEF domain-containing protein [Aurantiacibacter sp. 219JJ12-13]
MTVSAIIMMTLLVLGLGVMCAVISLALRRHESLLWMGAALGLGIIETFALKDGAITGLDLLLVCVTIPSSYICVGESVRTAFGEERASPRYFALMGGTIGLSCLLLQFPVPPVLQLLPCQLAGAAAMLRAVSCVKRNRLRRSVLDLSLLAALACVTCVYIVRIPFLPILVSLETPFMVMSRQTLQDALIAVFGVLVPSVVLLTVARVVANAVDYHRMRAELDILSALPNRRAFVDAMEDPRRGEGQVIVCDIDRFKAVNDSFGHSAGDAVIRAVAQLLEGRGLAARIGGEEFAIWLPGCNAADAYRHAEELRQDVANLRLLEILGDSPITASFGVASVASDAPLREILAAADLALYRAKHLGRNRVVTFDDLRTAPPQREKRAKTGQRRAA